MNIIIFKIDIIHYRLSRNKTRLSHYKMEPAFSDKTCVWLSGGGEITEFPDNVKDELLTLNLIYEDEYRLPKKLYHRDRS